MQKCLYIIIYGEVPAEDLTRVRIRPARGGYRLLTIGDVADAGVLEVVWVKLLIPLREVAYLDGVTEASSFEGLVPAEDTFTYRAVPAGRESAIEVEDDLLLRLRELSLGISLLVLGDELPAVR